MAATTVTLETLDKELKAIRKDLRKIKAHIEDPTGEKAKSRSENNGFKKPLQISGDLRAFLKLGPEDRISRADVTKRMNLYLEEHKLKNGQVITLDDTLKTLLNPPADTQITFLNIQKYINPHYIKEEKPATEKKPRAKKEKTESSTGEAMAGPSDAAAPKEKKLRPKVAKPAATATA